MLTGMRTWLRRRWVRRLSLGALLFLVVSLTAGYFWLTPGGLPLFRSPEAYFAERRGQSVVTEKQTIREQAASITETIHLQSSSGLEVVFNLRLPREHAGQQLPVFVIVGGHRTGKDAVHLLEGDGSFVVAALDYPFHQDKKMKGLRLAAHLAEMRQALYDMVPSLMLVADYLSSHPRVNAQRMELVGVSLGAPLACVAGALDQRFRRVWAIQGGGALPQLLDHNLRRRFPSTVPRWCLTRVVKLLVGTLAPERWVGRIAPRPFMQVAARDDERIPRLCSETLFRAAHEPKQLIWMEGEHVAPDKKERIQQLFQIVASHLEAEIPPPN